MKKFALLAVIVLLAIGCSPVKIDQTQDVMGTFATIIVYHGDKDLGEEAIESAFLEIERIEDLMSIYKNTTPVYILNEEGGVKDVANDVVFVLKKALEYGGLSEGAFDITVQPVLDLYKHSFSELGRAPTDEEIEEVLDVVDYDNIVIQYRDISFKKEGMKITLGGIAKGYAIDKAIEVLREDGIEHALVNIGGDMGAIGNKDGKDWQIGLQNPRNKKEYIAIIPINYKAVCTSGDYERYFDDSKKFHHIVNPKTGYSADELISVTIVADNALDCDALATGVFVLGKDKGLKLIESLENVEGLIITNEKEIVRSGGFDY